MLLAQARILPCADTALTVELGDDINQDVNAAVLALERRVLAARLSGIIETVPTYRSLTVHLDPTIADPLALGEKILALAVGGPETVSHQRTWLVPVVYGQEYGIDLDGVAESLGISPAEVVERHAAVEYRVCMIGFLPGYAYLGGLDPSLALSRRATPRPFTPAGTISIAGPQALIASVAAPSGWHLLGRTPVRSFMPNRDPVFLFEPGDAIRFHPIAASDWTALDSAAAAGAIVAEKV